MCQSGDVRALLQFEANELRSHLMDIMGLHLGLKPPGHSGQGLAMRVCAAETLAGAKSLPSDSVYIGQAHFSHRWKPSKWASPFQVGRDCAGATHVIKYAQWIANQPHKDKAWCATAPTTCSAMGMCWCAWYGTR